MEFEEMQIIWNSQNDEKLFTINEAALHAYIKRKNKSVNFWLELFEWVMIGVNFIVGITLAVVTLTENELFYQYILLSAFYIAFSIFALIRRVRRRSEQVRFENTMLGELDKGIWQIDYLLRQGQSMMLWYIVPLVIIASITMYFTATPLWLVGLMLAIGPFSYFGMRWEARKWHLPKKRSLESLRETLVASEAL